jgi:hypothetical protein
MVENMDNLLTETIEELKYNGLVPEDVIFCSVHDNYFSWKDFEALANVTYDSGFGIAEIDSSLMVVGKDWWLERHEYDGSEWWEFKRLPKVVNYVVPKSLLMRYKEDD